MVSCTRCRVRDSMGVCGHCRDVAYCSVGCQDEDWNESHGLMCVGARKGLPELTNALYDDCKDVTCFDYTRAQVISDNSAIWKDASLIMAVVSVTFKVYFKLGFNSYSSTLEEGDRKLEYPDDVNKGFTFLSNVSNFCSAVMGNKPAIANATYDRFVGYETSANMAKDIRKATRIAARDITVWTYKIIYSYVTHRGVAKLDGHNEKARSSIMTALYDLNIKPVQHKSKNGYYDILGFNAIHKDSFNVVARLMDEMSTALDITEHYRMLSMENPTVTDIIEICMKIARSMTTKIKRLKDAGHTDSLPLNPEYLRAVDSKMFVGPMPSYAAILSKTQSKAKTDAESEEDDIDFL